ncbi:MAG: ribonuclease P protein component 4 [Candidatus Micrarchaeia archaeon]
MKKNINIIKKISVYRINRLFQLAKEKTIENNEESVALSKRYIKLALLINKHYKAKAIKKNKIKICKNCLAVLIPGINSKVRVSKKVVLYKCVCGQENKIFK